MARKVENLTITDEGRDQGKVFVLTEMSAFDAEWWATKALLALCNSGIELPEDIKTAGMAGLVKIALEAFGKIHPDDVKPLLDKMLECVKVMPDPAKPRVIRPLDESDIEEVKTLITIRKAILDLHTGFFTQVAKP